MESCKKWVILWRPVILGTLVCALLYAQAYHAQGQEPVFSQYHQTPMQINPGCLGAYEELSLFINQRVSTNGSSLPLNAFIMSGIIPIKANQHALGSIGISATTSKEGQLGIFRRMGVSSAFAQQVRLTKKHRLGLGLQIGYQRNAFSGQVFTTSNQWVDGLGYSSSHSTGEYVSPFTTDFLSISTGIFWYMRDTWGEEKAYLGMAGFNLNQPNQSFTESNDLSPIRYAVSGGIWLLKNKRWMIMPEVLIQKERDTRWASFGSRFTYYLVPKSLISKESNLTTFLRYTALKSLVLGIQFERPQYTIGFSYDQNVSRDFAYLPVSTFEVVLAFKRHASNRIH